MDDGGDGPMMDQNHLGATPRISVVLAAFNAQDHLGAAIDSVRAQRGVSLELIVVDDCSSDRTLAVAERAKSEDPRVRVMSTEDNSGSAGQPRNLGIAAARGEFMTFLDSDDVLLPGALDLLLSAATAHRADIAAGLTVRAWQASGRTSRWQPALYESDRYVRSLLDEPDLLRDTNSTAKVYRAAFLRESGLLFPEGRVYEDIVFTSAAFIRSGPIAIVSDPVYEWRIYPSEVRRSVTGSLTSPANLAARLQAVDEVAALAAETRHPELTHVLAAKFLRHDAWVHVRAACARRNYQALADLSEVLAPRIAATEAKAFEELSPFRRFGYGCLLDGDLLGVVQASQLRAGFPGLPGRLTGPDQGCWQAADDGTFATPPTSSAGTGPDFGRLAGQLREVGSAGQEVLSDRERPPFVSVTHITPHRHSISLEGSIHDPGMHVEPGDVRIVALGTSEPLEASICERVKLSKTVWGFRWRAKVHVPGQGVRWPGARRLRLSFPGTTGRISTPVVASDGIVESAVRDANPMARVRAWTRTAAMTIVMDDEFAIRIRVKATSPWPASFRRRAR